MNSLSGTQKIIYLRGKEQISLLDSFNWDSLQENVQAYVRHLQPFTKEGQFLTIPRPEGLDWRTSEVQRVEVKEGKLVLQTTKSVYSIEYVGIDLARMLADGEGKGVNSSDGFPSLR